MSEKPKTGRTTPPTDDEWGNVWHAIDKAHRSWPIAAPFVAVYENWRAILFVVVAIGILNGPAIIDVLSSLWGIVP